MSEPVFTGGIPQHRAKLYRCLFCRVEPDLRKQEESGQGLVLDLRQCFCDRRDQEDDDGQRRLSSDVNSVVGKRIDDRGHIPVSSIDTEENDAR